MKFRMIALLTAGLAMFSAGIATAQEQGCPSIVLPNGTVLTCQVLPNGSKVYVGPGGLPVYPATTGGNGIFTITNTTTNPCSATLTPVSVNITSNNPVLGTINTTLDPTRPSTPSKITSSAAATQFPATEDIYFYANATLSSKPGVQYRSIQEIHLNSTNVRTFAPHRQEVFNSVGQVDFEDVALPGVIAFSLQSFTVTLN